MIQYFQQFLSNMNKVEASLVILEEAYNQDKINLNDYQILIEKASKYGHGKRKQLIPVKLKSGKVIYQKREVGHGELIKLAYLPLPNLSVEDRKIETKFGKYLNDNLQEVVKKYLKDNQNILGADNAKEYSEDYVKDKAKYSAAVHEPASAFVKYLYNKMLNEEIKKGQQNVVVFTAGGPGAGKTSGVKGIKELNQLNQKAQIVYDTSMTSFNSAKNKIDQALVHDKNVHVIYTYRDLIDSFEHGNLPRSKKIGRVVPINAHVSGHIDSFETIKKLYKNYKDNQSVIFDIIDNSLGIGNAVEISYEKLLKKVKYDEPSKYLKVINNLIEKQYETKQITESQYRGFTGKETTDSQNTVSGTTSTSKKESERVREARAEIASEAIKSLETIKLAFDNGQISNKQYLEVLEKAKRVEKRKHIGKKTGKVWYQKHNVGTEEKNTILISGRINEDNYEKFLNHLKLGGKLSASDLIDLRQVHRLMHTKESDELYERSKKGEITFKEASYEGGGLGEKLFKKYFEEQNIINRQENSFGLAGDKNAIETFHFTDADSIINILEDNKFESYGDYAGLSTTTNKFFDHPELTNVKWYGEGNKPFTFAMSGVRIDIDLEKIRQDNVRIRQGSEDIGTFIGEEELKLGKSDGIENASKYINQIQVNRKIVNDKDFNEIKNLAAKYDIKVIEKQEVDPFNVERELIVKNSENLKPQAHVLERLSSEEQRGRAKGGRRNVEASSICEAIHRADTDVGQAAEDIFGIRSKEETALKEYAQKENIWVEDPFKKFGNIPHAYGAEQNVYLNKEGTSVIKLNSATRYNSWLDFLDNISIHNTLFPMNAYELKGFTDLSGDFTAIVEQRYIIADRITTKEDVKDDMHKKGFSLIEKNDYLNSETGVWVKDLHPTNVLIDKQGNLQYIDPNIELSDERKQQSIEKSLEIFYDLLQKKQELKSELFKLIEQNPKIVSDELMKGEFANALEKSLDNSKKQYSDAIIYNHDGRILMLLRTAKDGKKELDNKWSLPGGHIDEGETPEQACVREVLEETNLVVDICSLMLIKKTADTVINIFSCHVDSDQLQLILDAHEHVNLKWVNKAELQELDCIYDLKETLNRLVFPDLHQQTLETYCENVIEFLRNAFEKQHCILINDVMTTFGITKEQFNNCFEIAQKRVEQANNKDIEKGGYGSGKYFHKRGYGRSSASSGYAGYSMSRRAEQAYEEGKLTYSKLPIWAKRLVDSGLVTTDEWHHTSSYFNETPFYNISQFNIFSDNENKELGIDWNNIDDFKKVPKNVIKIINIKTKEALKKLNNIKEVRTKYIEQSQKELNEFNSKFKRFSRVTSEPEYGKIESSEMSGKYGWFESQSKYSLPEYYSGIDYETAENESNARKLEGDLGRAKSDPIYKIELSKRGFNEIEINNLKLLGLITQEIMPKNFYDKIEKNKDIVKQQLQELSKLPKIDQQFNPRFNKSYEDFLTDQEKQTRQDKHYSISEQGDFFGTSHERFEAHEYNDEKWVEIAKDRYNKAYKEFLNNDEVKEQEKQFNEDKNKVKDIVDNLKSLFEIDEQNLDEIKEKSQDLSQFDASMIIISKAFDDGLIDDKTYFKYLEKASKYGEGKKYEYVDVKRDGKTFKQRRLVGSKSKEKLEVKFKNDNNLSIKDNNLYRNVHEDFLRVLLENDEVKAEGKKFISMSLDKDSGGQDRYGDIRIIMDKEKLMNVGAIEVDYEDKEFWEDFPDITQHVTGFRTEKEYNDQHGITDVADVMNRADLDFYQNAESYSGEQEVVIPKIKLEKNLIKQIQFEQQPSVKILQLLETYNIDYKITEHIDKALETIKLAFDNGQISNKQYLDALEKAKRIEKIKHVRKDTGKIYYQAHHVGSDINKEEILSDKLLQVGVDHFKHLRQFYLEKFPEEKNNIEEILDAELNREFSPYLFCLNAAENGNVSHNKFSIYDREAEHTERMCYYNALDYILKHQNDSYKLAYGFYIAEDELKRFFTNHEAIQNKTATFNRLQFTAIRHAFIIKDDGRVIDPTLKNQKGGYYFYQQVPKDIYDKFHHEFNDKTQDAREFAKYIEKEIENINVSGKNKIIRPKDKKIQESKKSKIQYKDIILPEKDFKISIRIGNKTNIVDVIQDTYGHGVTLKIRDEKQYLSGKDFQDKLKDGTYKIIQEQQTKKQSTIADIFQSAHGAINIDNLIPLRNLLGEEKMPTKEEFDAVVEHLSIDGDKLYYDASDVLTPIKYVDLPMYYGFFSLDKQAMEMMHVKEYINQQNKFFRDMKDSKDYETMFYRVDKKVLIPTFIRFYADIPDNQKYEAFITLYQRSEYGFGQFPEEIILDTFSKRGLSTNWDSRMIEFKQKFKDKILKIYRGETEKSAVESEAFSWTTDRKKAEFFATRFDSNGKVLEKEVSTNDVIDYIESRGESEVILLPKKFDDHIEKAHQTNKIGETKSWHGRNFKFGAGGWTHDDNEKNSKLKTEKSKQKFKIQDFSDEELDNHAHRSSLTDLQKIVKDGKHPKLREIAQRHLATRKAKDQEHSLYDLMLMENHEGDEHNYSADDNTIFFDEDPGAEITDKFDRHGIKYLVNGKEVKDVKKKDKIIKARTIMSNKPKNKKYKFVYDEEDIKGLQEVKKDYDDENDDELLDEDEVIIPLDDDE